MKLTTKNLSYIIKHWEDKTTQELADDLQVSNTIIYNWTYKFRKAGGVLPKKARMEQEYTATIISEVIDIQKAGKLPQFKG